LFVYKNVEIYTLESYFLNLQKVGNTWGCVGRANKVELHSEKKFKDLLGVTNRFNSFITVPTWGYCEEAMVGQ